MADRKKPRDISDPIGDDLPAFLRRPHSEKWERLRAAHPKEMARLVEITKEFILAEMGLVEVGHKPLSPRERKALEQEGLRISRSIGIAPQHKLH